MASKKQRTTRGDQTPTGQGLRLVAGVLIGGKSKRMGRPKALLAMPDGRTLVEHVVTLAQSFGPVVEETVLLGGLDALPPSLSSFPAHPDGVPDAGPLAGLLSLLACAANRWALLLSCDMPLLTAPVLRRLLAEARDDVDAVAFVKGDQPDIYHACCALYHPRVMLLAKDRLSQGKRSLQGLLGELHTAALRPSPQEDRRLFNINTPAQHERALRYLDEQARSAKKSAHRD